MSRQEWQALLRLDSPSEKRAAARNSRPTGLAAARLCLDRLATSAGAVVASLEADPEHSKSQAQEWAYTLHRQCQDALDELTFLAPWILLPASPALPQDVGGFPDIEESPRYASWPGSRRGSCRP